MIQVLVTGAAGQLGKALEMTAPRQESLEATYLIKKDLDVTSLEALRAYFATHQITHLVNCAAYTHVDAAEKEHTIAYALNAQAPSYLATFAKRHAFKLIHISTDYVFGKNGSTQPITELQRPCPLNYYGYTKYCGEQKILATNIDAYIIRTSWLYSHLGENFLTRFLHAAQTGKTIHMAYDQVSSPTYAIDLAKAIWQLIINTSGQQPICPPGVYHMANEGVASRLDFAYYVKEKAKLANKLISIPHYAHQIKPVAERPAYSVLCKEKWKHIFNIEIPHWQTSLTHCINQLCL